MPKPPLSTFEQSLLSSRHQDFHRFISRIKPTHEDVNRAFLESNCLIQLFENAV
jgi:hypothetical protein